MMKTANVLAFVLLLCIVMSSCAERTLMDEILSLLSEVDASPYEQKCRDENKSLVDRFLETQKANYENNIYLAQMKAQRVMLKRAIEELKRSGGPTRELEYRLFMTDAGIEQRMKTPFKEMIDTAKSQYCEAWRACMKRQGDSSIGPDACFGLA